MNSYLEGFVCRRKGRGEGGTEGERGKGVGEKGKEGRRREGL